MDILLNVPFVEKDKAKKRGAKWNPKLKSWYTNDVGRLKDVSRWLDGCNIVCETLYLLKKWQICRRCEKTTSVYLLATDKSYAKEEDFRCNQNLQLLTYVMKMPAPLSGYLKEKRYYPAYSKTINDTYYINHCQVCKAIQGDHFLHEIPEQSFYAGLIYPDREPITYAKIKNTFCVPFEACLPEYDRWNMSLELIFAHMETGRENRASLRIDQKLINGLLPASILVDDIKILGL